MVKWKKKISLYCSPLFSLGKKSSFYDGKQFSGVKELKI